jgi:SAM-dependent methyltransferase
MLSPGINELWMSFIKSNIPNSDMEKSMTNKEIIWNNGDNNAFYETIEAEGLKELAEKGGLATGCDLKALKPYWSKAHSILEVGAGYGRVIDYLLKHEFRGEITAIERCDAQFAYLKKRFQSNKKVHLLHADIKYLGDLGKNFDLILYMWCGILDFTYAEQCLVIKNLAKLLKKNGALAIDTLPDHIVPLKTKKCAERLYKLEVNNASIYCQLFTIQDMGNYAMEANFSNVLHVNYQTDTGREKLLYILS